MELRPNQEKDTISSQKPKRSEIIKAVLRLANRRMKNKMIKLKLIAEKKGGRAEIKAEWTMATKENIAP